MDTSVETIVVASGPQPTGAISLDTLRRAAAVLNGMQAREHYCVHIHPSHERWMAGAHAGCVTGAWPRRGSMRARKRATASMRWSRRLPGRWQGFDIMVG